MIDIVDQINATHRKIGDHPVAAGEGRSLLLRRTYPDRISRWPAPIEGDLRDIACGVQHFAPETSGDDR